MKVTRPVSAVIEEGVLAEVETSRLDKAVPTEMPGAAHVAAEVPSGVLDKPDAIGKAEAAVDPGLDQEFASLTDNIVAEALAEDTQEAASSTEAETTPVTVGDQEGTNVPPLRIAAPHAVAMRDLVETIFRDNGADFHRLEQDVISRIAGHPFDPNPRQVRAIPDGTARHL